MVCNVICCFGCEFKQLIAKMQVFLRKKEEKRVERDRGRNRERDLERVPCLLVFLSSCCSCRALLCLFECPCGQKSIKSETNQTNNIL